MGVVSERCSIFTEFLSFTAKSTILPYGMRDSQGKLILFRSGRLGDDVWVYLKLVASCSFAVNSRIIMRTIA